MPQEENNLTGSDKTSSYKRGILSELDLKILWLARTLTNIDLQYEAELFRLEESCIPVDLKISIREEMNVRHRKRCEPYVSLLNGLRSQSLAGPSKPKGNMPETIH
jgi:hypothetical protein